MKQIVFTIIMCLLLCLISSFFIQQAIYFEKAVEHKAPINTTPNMEAPSPAFNFTLFKNEKDDSILEYYFNASSNSLGWELPQKEPSQHDLAIKKRQEEKEKIFREFLSLQTDSNFVYYPYYYDAVEAKTHTIKMTKEWQQFVYGCCKKYHIANYYKIVLGLMGVESGFNVHIGVSDNQKYIGPGMLHIEYNEEYIQQHYELDIFTPEGATEAVCAVFAEKLKAFDYNVTFALMAYNHGNNGARQEIESGIYHTGYTDKVIMIANGLRIKK